MTRALTALGLLLALGASACAQSLRVIDGDTVSVRGEAVRIVGLDAPEIHGRCPAESRLARQAQARLAELLAGGATITRRGRDRYGRGLAIVQDAEGRDVAQVMISEGLARPYDGRGRRAGWC
ncbi:thermonuclease family protein [Roseomonas eburnea]|uniref:Thermonuclease family protein n=1 Tax=Neoroseomonas eburnea TaxID=1346889 RepID=A0A9X9XE07_9PROT|nr:thermonuclease family protein [Neoroseomonas eburnea]MBR0681943.1 thermonuclease family protein [Neoroseomonas eburnea]